MKRGIYLSFIALIVTLLYTIDGVHAQSDTPQHGALISVDSVAHDFGVVNRREGDIRHSFWIVNRGDEPLVITRIVASCSCMKHSISRKPIAVGEHRELKLTYELKKMPPGRFSKSVVVYTTTRDKRSVSFTLSGRSSHTTRREYKNK